MPARFQFRFILQHLNDMKRFSFPGSILLPLVAIKSLAPTNLRMAVLVAISHVCMLEMFSSEEHVLECVTSRCLDN